MNQDINFTMEIQEEIHNISMEMLDLVTVIGIFMDNAIEAALVTEDKHMTVIIIDNSVSVTIIISNSAPDIDINLDEIYNRDITYKKNPTVDIFGKKYDLNIVFININDDIDKNELKRLCREYDNT